MDNKMITICMAALAGVVYLFLILQIPLRIKKLKKESGALLMEFSRPENFRTVLILLFCALLIFVVPMRDFAIYMSAIFLGVALIGCYMACKEISNSKLTGIYENIIISSSNSIKYEEIEALPTLAYENDPETTQVDFTVLEVLLKNGSKHQIIFNNESEREQAVKVITECCPRLAL